MSRTDIIADALTILRNAVMAKKQTADLPYSKMIESILKILKEKNYLQDYKLMEIPTKKNSKYKKKLFRAYIKYISSTPVITNLKKISKPGLRVYVTKDKIPSVLRGYGIAILSTSKGIMTDKEAREKKIGGEVLCYVW